MGILDILLWVNYMVVDLAISLRYYPILLCHISKSEFLDMKRSDHLEIQKGKFLISWRIHGNHQFNPKKVWIHLMVKTIMDKAMEVT